MTTMNLKSFKRVGDAGRLAARGVIMLAMGWALAQPVAAQIVPVARVNGVPIFMDSLDRQFEELLRERRINIARMQDPNKAKTMRREALDNLIRVELLWQEAKTEGLAASDAEVEKAMAEARKGSRTKEAFERRIETLGYNEKTYREYLRKLLSGNRLAQRIVDRDVKVTDKDIEDFYDLNVKLFKRDERVKIRQIMVAVPAQSSAEQKAEARTRIEGLLARVRAGEDFEALARQNSDDATRQWGGELDPFSRGEQAPPFEAAAFALATGAVSDVVETKAGLHILKLEERMAAEIVPIDQARERIRGYLMNTRGKEAIDKEVEQLRSLGKVEVLTPL